MAQQVTAQSATFLGGDCTPTGIQYLEPVDPDSLEARQALLMCRIMFGLGEAEVADLREELKDSQGLWPNRIHLVVARHQGKVVGFALFYHLAEVNLGYMEYIAVAPGYQRQGIGRGLYNAAVEILERDSQGVKGMLFEVQNADTGLNARKDFFLNMGAIPMDLSFYPLRPEITESGMLMMLHPLRRVQMTWPTLVKVFDNLSMVLNH